MTIPNLDPRMTAMLKLADKYKEPITNIINKVKENKITGEAEEAKFGRECRDLIDSFLNISVKDFL